MNPIIGCKYCVLKFVKSSIVCVRRRYVWQRFHGILNRNLKLPWYLKIVARYDVSRKHYATVSPFWRANSPRDSPRKLIAARNNKSRRDSSVRSVSSQQPHYGLRCSRSLSVMLVARSTHSVLSKCFESMANTYSWC